MKKIIGFWVVFSIFFSCDKKSEVEKQIVTIPLSINLDRFDKAFFETPVNELSELKGKYPYFFPLNTPDSVWTNKMKNPLWRALYGEVQKKYPTFEQEKEDIENLFQHIKFYFPKTKTPKIITLISEMDYNAKTIYADSLVLISLEMYLGKSHKFYEFPDYLKQNFEQNQILPDLVSSFSLRKIPPPSDKSLLAQMVYAGKELYLKDLLLPQATDGVKIGYTEEQIKWCDENETYMWRYFIQEKLLYSTESKLANRFINLAPFSKFYLEIDNETPGRVGAWVGWQIVRSYMKNNDVSLQELLLMDAQELFNKSKYKPKKE